MINETMRQPGDAETLLRLIFGLSTNFISLPPEDVDDGICDVLKAIGTFAHVDRSCVFQFSDNGNGIMRTHEWSADGLKARQIHISAERVPWFCEKIRNCEVVHIPDVEKLPPEAIREKHEFSDKGIRSIVAVPIVSGYAVMGFIEFESLCSDNTWTENIISLLKIVGEIFAFALSRKRITDALKQSESKYKTLFEYASDAIFLIEGFTFVDCNTKGLSMLACTREQIIGGSPLEFSPQFQPDGIDSSQSLLHKASLALSGTPQFFEWKQCRRDGTLFDAELSFNRVELGRQVFLQAIVRDITDRKEAEEKLAFTLQDLRKAMGGTIEVIVHVVETRDPYTAGHQRRVADLAGSIGAEMHLSSRIIEGIRMAGVIHDIGKISVPAEILSKPGALSHKEFELIKDHAQTGYDILKDVEFSWPIAQIIQQHHEKLDGSGYPQGLRGDDLLIEARILTVADVIEAIASHRPYRPARGIEIALSEIEQNRGLLTMPTWSTRASSSSGKRDTSFAEPRSERQEGMPFARRKCGILNHSYENRNPVRRRHGAQCPLRLLALPSEKILGAVDSRGSSPGGSGHRPARGERNRLALCHISPVCRGFFRGPVSGRQDWPALIPSFCPWKAARSHEIGYPAPETPISPMTSSTISTILTPF